MNKIKIVAGDVSAFAELNNTPTARAIWAALPIEARANTWGDEIYFAVKLKRGEEAGSTEVVKMGELGYWPPGKAFCIFFGPTPASVGNEIRAASAVNVVGNVEGDATVFRKVTEGTTVVVSRADKE